MRASLPGCGVGCSIRGMAAQMSPPLLAEGAGEGAWGVGGSGRHAAACKIPL